MSSRNKSLSRLALTAMFAALTTALTYFIKIPTPLGGYIHIGDSMIYLMACFLPTPYAMIGAGIGGALSDLLGGYFVYVLPTFIIKMLIAIPFTSKSERTITLRNAIMVVPAGIISIVGYYLTSVVLLAVDGITKSAGFIDQVFNGAIWYAALIDIPGNGIQALGSAIAFILIGLAFDGVKMKKKVSRLA